MMAAISQKNSDSDVLVRDIDGQYKVFHEGMLAPLTTVQGQTVPSFSQPAVPMTDEHFLGLPAPLAKSEGAAIFGFHPDDEADLQKELEKITTLLVGHEQKKYSLEKIIEKIIEKNKLTLSPDRLRRFSAILFSFFRHSRSPIHVRALLLEKSDTGISLPETTVEAVMSVITILRDKIESVEGVVVREAELALGVSDQPAEEETKQPESPKIEPTIPKSEPVVPKVEVVEPVSIPVMREAAMPNGNDLPKVQRPTASDMKLPSMPTARKYTSAKVMGKIDELAEMTVEQFRQIDTDPRMAAAKILQRINTLEKDSLMRKAQGIEAWRSNQVYGLYLRMGQLGLEQHKDIAAISSMLASQNEAYLSSEEFEAITDLNKYLRF